MQKFISIPCQIHRDITEGKLIGNDLTVFMHLASKGGHGERIYTTRESIQEALGGASPSKISDSLKRLSVAGHIKRKKLNGITSTRLLTFVKDAKNIYVKGKLV